MYSSIASISLAFSLHQMTRPRRPSNTIVSPILNLMLRGSTFPCLTDACSLDLSLHYEYCLITHLFAVKHVDSFLNSGVVFELDVAECRRYICDKDQYDPYGARFDSEGLHQFLQL